MKSILKWFQEKKQKDKQNLYDKGFDYALSAIVRGGKTPLVLDAEQYEIDRNQFDVGMDAAIDYAIQHELVKDDRV